ncbi:MAG: phosphopantothenoylcysteine decarboxylase, partial [Acidimicrobiales bacterium]
RLAGGDSGPGRLAEPGEIFDAVASVLATGSPGPLAGVRVLVSAGGTREPLDPVRFIGNRSSGKQGHALADRAAAGGAEVTLVTTVDLRTDSRVRVVRVETAAQMEAAMVDLARPADIVVLAAAVADFRPRTAHPTKLRRGDGPPEVVLEPVPDISAALARAKPAGQVLVGFAAETAAGPPDLVTRARAKLDAKGLDLIVANDVSAPEVGFEHDTNAVTIVGAGGEVMEVPLAPKATVADAVLVAAKAVLDGGGAGLAR